MSMLDAQSRFRSRGRRAPFARMITAAFALAVPLWAAIIAAAVILAR